MVDLQKILPQLRHRLSVPSLICLNTSSKGVDLEVSYHLSTLAPTHVTVTQRQIGSNLSEESNLQGILEFLIYR